MNRVAIKKLKETITPEKKVVKKGVKKAVKEVLKKPIKPATEKKVNLVSKAIAQREINTLLQTYPEAECELDYKTDFQLLIAVILSAQSTDVTINKVTPELFRHYPTPKDLADADIEHIKKLIKQSGFFNAKAKNIQACARDIVTKHGGVVPTVHEQLIALPGVGRKTANVVLGVAHGVSGWSVDTHVQRLSRRLGFTKETDPYKIELGLQKLFPGQDWSKLSITLIFHGRRCCYARKPDCPKCPINDICPSSEVRPCEVAKSLAF